MQRCGPTVQEHHESEVLATVIMPEIQVREVRVSTARWGPDFKLCAHETHIYAAA